MKTNALEDVVTVDFNKSLIYGKTGIAGFHTNVSGGMEIDDVSGTMSDKEIEIARNEIEGRKDIIIPDDPQNEILQLISWEETNNFSTVDLVKEYYNVDEAIIDEHGDIWIGGANGQWLEEDDLRNFIEWACNK